MTPVCFEDLQIMRFLANQGFYQASLADSKPIFNLESSQEELGEIVRADPGKPRIPSRAMRSGISFDGGVYHRFVLNLRAQISAEKRHFERSRHKKYVIEIRLPCGNWNCLFMQRGGVPSSFSHALFSLAKNRVASARYRTIFLFHGRREK